MLLGGNGYGGDGESVGISGGGLGNGDGGVGNGYRGCGMCGIRGGCRREYGHPRSIPALG